jgi:heme exporter protein D
MTNRTFKIWFAFCVAMIPVALIIRTSVWNECRTEGNSLSYCIALISSK